MNQLLQDSKVLSKKLPRGEKSKRTLCFRKSEYFNGPLPHPEIFERYEETLPGAADRIIRMAEKQSLHRQQLELKVICSNIDNEKRGMYLAFSITMIFVIGGFCLILLNKNIAGYTALISTFGFHIYNYLSQKKKEPTNISQKSGKKDKK